MSVVMPFSTERVLLAWVEDLEQGLEELSRSSRKHNSDAQRDDLLQSARGLLDLAQSELRKLPVPRIPLLDADAGDIRSADDIRQLCDGIRRLFHADGGNESSD